jgi:hypothetical protein
MAVLIIIGFALLAVFALSFLIKGAYRKRGFGRDATPWWIFEAGAKENSPQPSDQQAQPHHPHGHGGGHHHHHHPGGFDGGNAGGHHHSGGFDGGGGGHHH